MDFLVHGILLMLLSSSIGTHVASSSIYSELECSDFAKKEPQYRSCKATNACYHEGQWILLMSKPSRWAAVKPLLNLGSYASSPTFEFSTVLDQTIQEFSALYQPIWIDNNIVYTAIGHHLYWHWVMDDLFSLHWMLKHYNLFDQNHELILASGFNTRYSAMLPQFFTKEVPYQLSSYLENQKQLKNSSSNSICFTTMFIGPAGHHVGGPGYSQIKPSDIREFSTFLQTKIGLQAFPPATKPLVTVVQRKGDREIANKVDFVTRIEEYLQQQGIEMKAVVMESLSYKEQVELMQKTTTLIAVHGSAMTNIIFLPEHASIVEIFPYGFERPTYRFLAKQLNLNYISWQNPHKHNAIFHPEILDRFHLTEDRRSAIVDADSFSVGMEWAGNMYWINQDTIVDLENFISVALEKAVTRWIQQ